MGSNWPEGEGVKDEKAEEEMALLREVISEVRSIRAEMGIPPPSRIKVLLCTPNPPYLKILRENSSYILDLAGVERLTIDSKVKRPERCASGIVKDVDIFIPLEKVIDIEKEKKRLGKEIGKVEEELLEVKRKLSSTWFLQKAPGEVVEKEKERENRLKIKLDKLRKRLADLG